MPGVGFVAFLVAAEFYLSGSHVLCTVKPLMVNRLLALVDLLAIRGNKKLCSLPKIRDPVLSPRRRPEANVLDYFPTCLVRRRQDPE